MIRTDVYFDTILLRGPPGKTLSEIAMKLEATAIIVGILIFAIISTYGFYERL